MKQNLTDITRRNRHNYNYMWRFYHSFLITERIGKKDYEKFE